MHYIVVLNLTFDRHVHDLMNDQMISGLEFTCRKVFEIPDGFQLALDGFSASFVSANLPLIIHVKLLTMHDVLRL
jgi:hypothetical protein